MAKKDDIESKWSGVIHKSTLNNFIKADNTPTTKYLDFMCNMWNITRGCSDRPSTSTQLIKTVLKFDELLPYIKNKDIYSYKGWGHFHKVVEDAHETKMDKEFVRETHVDVLIENDYLSHRSDGPIVNSVQIFCAEDHSHGSTSLTKSDWSVIEILHFQNLVRSIAVKNWTVSHSKKNVQDFIKKMHQLNIEQVLSELSTVQNGAGSEYEKLVTDFKESVEKFTTKIKLSI